MAIFGGQRLLGRMHASILFERPVTIVGVHKLDERARHSGGPTPVTKANGVLEAEGVLAVSAKVSPLSCRLALRHICARFGGALTLVSIGACRGSPHFHRTHSSHPVDV